MNVMHHLKRIQYKKNWEFDFRQQFAPNDFMHRHPDSIDVMMTMFVPNVCSKEGEEIKVCSILSLPMPEWIKRSPEELFDFVFHAIKSLEDHEAEEWFKIDGQRFIKEFNQPHEGEENETTR